MIATLIKLTSIVLLMLIALMGVALWWGFETNDFSFFRDAMDTTFGFLLLTGIWYLIAPPHLAVTRATSKKSREISKDL